jgi:hypothetical protein
MGYRDVSESLRAYRERIAADLEEARRAAKEAAERASKVAVLERELAETDGLLAKMGGARRGLPMLDDVRIAAPCKANWDAMPGDDHVRFCGQCEKNVYNLSSLSREEAEALLVAREGKMCVRLFRRDDGTVLTDDCPVGVKKRRRRRTAVALFGGGMMAAATAASAGLSSQAPMGSIVPPDPAPSAMGSIAVDPPVQPTPTATAIPVPAKPAKPANSGQRSGGAVARPPQPTMGKIDPLAE